MNNRFRPENRIAQFDVNSFDSVSPYQSVQYKESFTVSNTLFAMDELSTGFIVTKWLGKKYKQLNIMHPDGYIFNGHDLKWVVNAINLASDKKSITWLKHLRHVLLMKPVPTASMMQDYQRIRILTAIKRKLKELNSQ